MRAIIIAFVLFCALSPARANQEAPNDGTAAAIRALEQEWTVGQSHNDIAVLDLIFDNAVVYVEYGKLVTKGEYLARIRAQQPESGQIVMQAMTVHLFGQTAIVVGTYLETQNRGGRHESKRWRFIDTWVYKKDGWVLVAAGATPTAKLLIEPFLLSAAR